MQTILYEADRILITTVFGRKKEQCRKLLDNFGVF